jgi:hypothetical protein
MAPQGLSYGAAAEGGKLDGTVLTLGAHVIRKNHVVSSNGYT